MNKISFITVFNQRYSFSSTWCAYRQRCALLKRISMREKKNTIQQVRWECSDEQNLKGEKDRLTGVKRQTAHSQAKYPPRGRGWKGGGGGGGEQPVSLIDWLHFKRSSLLCAARSSKAESRNWVTIHAIYTRWCAHTLVSEEWDLAKKLSKFVRTSH